MFLWFYVVQKSSKWLGFKPQCNTRFQQQLSLWQINNKGGSLIRFSVGRNEAIMVFDYFFTNG
jgi:hypothetical protein